MTHVHRNRCPPCRTDHAYVAGTRAWWPQPSRRFPPRGSVESGFAQSVSRRPDHLQSLQLRTLDHIACVAKVPNPILTPRIWLLFLPGSPFRASPGSKTMEIALSPLAFPRRAPRLSPHPATHIAAAPP